MTASKRASYIVAEAATYIYREGFALKNIDLQLCLGESCFIMGKNGSGKSTLGKLLAGIYKPVGGKVYLNGQDSAQMSLGQVGKEVGYLWQKPDLQLFAPTVWEELTFLGYWQQEDKKQVNEKADYWLKELGLEHLKEAACHTLSRGEKQRLALATILARIGGNMKYLILDEPTTGLDQERREQLYKILESLQDLGITMAVISHDETLIRKMSWRLIRMDGGVIVTDDRPAY